MDLDHKINDVLPLNAGGRGVLKAQALIFIILLAFTTCGRVMLWKEKEQSFNRLSQKTFSCKLNTILHHKV